MQFNITAEDGNYEDIDYYEGHVRFNATFRSTAKEQFEYYLAYLVEQGFDPESDDEEDKEYRDELITYLGDLGIN